MIKSQGSKEELLDLLLTTQERGGRLYSRLLRLRRNEEAAKVRSRNRRLLRKIETLWVEIAKDWQGTAQSNIKNLKAMNANIKRSITGLKHKTKRAKNIARALSLLDDVIELASGLVK